MAALWAGLELLGLSLYTGRVFSYLVAATFTWAGNRSLTFANAPDIGALRQWARFVFFNALGGLVNFAVYVLVAIKLREFFALADPVDALLPYVGVACGSVSGLALNFLASKFLVFR